MKYKAWDKEFKRFRDEILIKPDGSIFVHLFQNTNKTGGLTVLFNEKNDDFEIEVITESESVIAQEKVY